MSPRLGWPVCVSASSGKALHPACQVRCAQLHRCHVAQWPRPAAADIEQSVSYCSSGGSRAQRAVPKRPTTVRMRVAAQSVNKPAGRCHVHVYLLV